MNTAALDQIPDWYEWDAEESDSGWLLTYVDVLSVVLAMLLVILARLATGGEPESAVAPVAGTPDNQTPVAIATPAANASVRTVAQPMPTRPVPAIAPTLTVVLAPDSRPASVPPTVDEETATAEAGPDAVAMPDPETRLIDAVRARFPEEITAVSVEQGVSLQIADVILFDSGRATLLPAARPVLERLAILLKETDPERIAVNGHTDDRPLRGGPYRSNWELAGARASAVTRFLLKQGLGADRLRVVSFADTRPVADNASPSGRARNRRVELTLEFPAS